MKEGQFNAKLVKYLKSDGFFAYKTADRFKGGVLDIYVSSGIWVESKVYTLPKRGNPVLLKGWTEQQIEFARDVTDHDDLVFCSFLFIDGRDKYVQFSPWREIFPSTIFNFDRIRKVERGLGLNEKLLVDVIKEELKWRYM